MGKAGAYLQIGRQGHGMRDAADAVRDYEDLVIDLPRDGQRKQASRCMNCGVPFCQSGLAFNGARQATGCPLHNLIPETNDLLFRGRWDEAVQRLAMTNPFPEFTGRVCPAPCETACNLGLHDDAVTVHDNERALSDYAWEHAVPPLAPAAADAPLASVVGSGPAGLACAWELARCGWRVRVYERDERPGGLLMYGIPAMKLPKSIVERRIALMEKSGIEFVCGTDASAEAEAIASESAAVVLAIGAREPRRVDVPGAELAGIHFAVDYLAESTRALLDGRAPDISAQGKDVAVIGGGDTGVDCVATALRQGARSVRQVIRAARPASADELADEAAFAWPGPRNAYGQAYGHREAAAIFGEDPRLFSTDTVGFADDGAGHVTAVRVADIPAADEEREIPAQLVLVAKGFTGPEQSVLDAFKEFDNVHVAGDARTGATIVASAIADGMRAADSVKGSLARR